MRVAGHGRIDRGRSIGFTFDGRVMTGHPGDTLASALLANDVRLVARSFKYHRPRGILTAGPEEPNALVSVIEGGLPTPNTRATVQELYEGLQAHSQNRWPSLQLDLLGINDAAAPVLGAGFYYKTFMWPRRFWEGLYEPLIRRAAGIGRLARSPGPGGWQAVGPHEKAFAFCDLLVIGAGPAGLMAALTAARAGADVILAEQDSAPGGRLLAEAATLDDRSGAEWAASVAAELAAMPNVRVMLRTTVTGAYDHGSYGALERVGLHLPAAEAGHPRPPRECFWRIVARRAVLASGALERPIAFGGNDRPGVMLASALRAYLHRWGVLPGRRVAVFGAHDDIYRTAADLQAAGATIAAVIDARADAPVPPDLPPGTGADWPVLREAVVTRTRGRLGLRAVEVTEAGRPRWIDADVLGVAGGWNPTLALTAHMGARPVWNDELAAFLPPPPDAPGAVPGLSVCGAAAGSFATAACLASGVLAGQQAAADLGLAPGAAAPLPDTGPEGAAAPAQRALWQVPGKGRAWLDFANDVTTKDVALAAQEGFTSVEHMKRYTTQGMAPDQGRSSNVAALAVLADATGRGIAQTGTTTFRPPFQPVSIAAMGAGAQGKGFAPERRSTADAAMRRRGAPMIEAGLWFRPSYFPAPGETTWAEACAREVAMVRGTVGIADVSTLGKIALGGPDTGAFLDFVYANTFSTLKPGRVRYGLMLREDGHVMDDGTCARLDADRWLMTTTTAAAGAVMRHLEHAHQVLRPDLATRFVSVTDQWAQFAVAGPLSRRLLASMLDDPGLLEVLPFMGCAPVSVMGVAARLFRISFSGELGYELAVPARFGAAVFADICARAEVLGGGPYGMEALNVLRLEKGFITHAEIHGRVTAFDIGMDRMVAGGKACIGKAARLRPMLHGPHREQLVGLRPVDPQAELAAGGHLFAPGAAAVRGNAQGYVTSTGYSPTLGSWIALGFLRDGPARHGETLRVVDHLRGRDTPCRVGPPVMFDPEGGRMRG